MDPNITGQEECDVNKEAISCSQRTVLPFQSPDKPVSTVDREASIKEDCELAIISSFSLSTSKTHENFDDTVKIKHEPADKGVALSASAVSIKLERDCDVIDEHLNSLRNGQVNNSDADTCVVVKEETGEICDVIELSQESGSATSHKPADTDYCMYHKVDVKQLFHVR